jgi:hypothetical protein
MSMVSLLLFFYKSMVSLFQFVDMEVAPFLTLPFLAPQAVMELTEPALLDRIVKSPLNIPLGFRVFELWLIGLS